MKNYKCLMGVMLSVVLLIGSAFGENTLNKEDVIKQASGSVKVYSPKAVNTRDECSDSFMVYGSDQSGAYYGACWSDGTGYFSFEWSGGCTATSITYSGSTLDISTYGFTEGFFFYGFDPGAEEVFEMEFDSNSIGSGAATNDCASCEDNGDVTCWDTSCAATEADCPEVGDCGAGQVIDCADDDCCPESWIGDGFEDCEDQQYGCDLTCYDNDGGDCDGGTTGGTTGGTESCADCEFDWTDYGAECCDAAYESNGITCADLEGNYGWDCSGCNCPGDGDPVCGDGSCNGDETYETCPDDCLPPGECPDGQIVDCDGTNECWPESWIGDGFGDCEAQDYGADLTCYDCDGGDCPDTDPGCSSCAEQGLIECDDGSCAASEEDCPEPEGCPDGTVDDCSGDGDCCFETWIGDGTYCDDGYQNGGACDLTCYDNDGGDCDGSDCPSEAGSGDVNGDGSSDVLDIVQIVNVILGGSFADDCAAEAADMNGDGSADVLDIVQIVNGILGRSDVGDATTGTLIRDNGALMLEANGYIGGVQMTLSHDGDFSIDLTDKAMVAEYNTVENETILVIVAPEGEELFTYTGDFEIVDMIIANSQDRVNVSAPTEFSLSTAYPNPFNPTTSLELSVPMNGQVTVQVYNLMGQVVATLANGYMDASTYTLTWDASNVASGMYLVKAEAVGNVTTQKLLLMK